MAKSFVDIASMLKEIKEGQQVTATLLKRQPDGLQQKPIKHCEIFSCNSHHTDECPQLQEDNTVATAQNFFELTAIPPYNKQYYTQGWSDGQPTHWNLPQQQKSQPRQPYTYSQPQNAQNSKYQPPHNRQQYPPSNNPPVSYDEALRMFQRENQEIRESQKRTEPQLAQLTEMLHKITNQPTQTQPPAPNPLPSQPLPNPKGGINVVHSKEAMEKKMRMKTKKEVLSGGACSSIMPFELYKFFKLGPLKETKEIFTTADASVVSIVGIAENVLVRIGELTIPVDFHIIKPTKGEKGGDATDIPPYTTSKASEERLPPTAGGQRKEGPKEEGESCSENEEELRRKSS
ncbi:hypothetical protein PIB30_090421 [Stylosanthes scabra]|uniref:Uncharacterized protein n=1 Tax=Stylosanthes scabra TaxID=79078 RepID=A0ABU6VV82_9FABA|nr:hypothetical protein [Stylosanthes scabra]